MFKYQLGEEVRDESYIYYKSRFMYRVSERHYTEFLSPVGELLYNRTYTLSLATDEGKKPTTSVAAGFWSTRKNIEEKDLVTEIIYQERVAALALPGSP